VVKGESSGDIARASQEKQKLMTSKQRHNRIMLLYCRSVELEKNLAFRHDPKVVKATVSF
jgi:hypothetical protein